MPIKNNSNIFLITDIFVSVISLYFSFLLRFDFDSNEIKGYLNFNYLWIFPLCQVIVFFSLGLYDRLWRYTSLFDLYDILKGGLYSSLFSFFILFLFIGLDGFPRSVFILYFILNTLLISSIRLSVRIYFTHYKGLFLRSNNNSAKLLLIIGAGRVADKIAREILSENQSQYKIIGFADDNKKKIGALLHGKKVLCSVKDINLIKIKFDEILITVPSASGDQMRQIVESCKKTNKRYKTVPSVYELINQELNLSSIRDVSYADLLGREEVVLDLESIRELIKSKRVLITGAGGSIGSELLRQCLFFNPGEIICVDSSEENLFKIQSEMESKSYQTIIRPILADICSTMEMEKVFKDYLPQIVFHAAAYKHVPIQEIHPWAAVKTNVGGTLNLVNLTNKFNIEKFVLVSTDKAVNPVNIMGATKRLAEKIIQSVNLISNTAFLAVRFGNVLGSSGSAIPTFQKQINKGGPVTITHPEMTRYFMSIQEASQLILQSAAIDNRNGHIYLLEMGKPIKIDKMARDLIRLSGYEPDIDIPLIYTGLRPGEKLYEELQSLEEKKLKTRHSKIMALKENKKNISWVELSILIKKLLDTSKELDSDKIQNNLMRLIPTYQPRSIKKIVLEKKIESFQQKIEA